jgi:hypothetical protein
MHREGDVSSPVTGLIQADYGITSWDPTICLEWVLLQSGQAQSGYERKEGLIVCMRTLPGRTGHNLDDTDYDSVAHMDKETVVMRDNRQYLVRFNLTS